MTVLPKGFKDTYDFFSVVKLGNKNDLMKFKLKKDKFIFATEDFGMRV